MVKPLKCRLHIISPVHIGCDDVYEPTSFVIDEKKGRLIEFDPMDFIKMLSQKDREELSKKCMGDDLLGIFKFIKAKYNIAVERKEVEICKILSDHYKKVLQLNTFNKNVVINQFTISKTVYNPHNGLPYLPGSSIKGAMRTAYLSKLATERGIISSRGKAKALEEELLGGSFGADPFRMVKISDFLPIENVRAKIVYAVNRKKKRSEKPTKADSGPPQILEVNQHGSVFQGFINIQEPLPKSNIKRQIGDTNFLNAINDFSQRLFELENIVGTEIGIDHVDTSKFHEQFGNTAFLMRIGRHSGAEAVTIEGNRNIKIMQGRDQPPKFLDHATTLWLASDSNRPAMNSELTPFGWVVLELLPFDVKNLYPVSSITTKPAISENVENLPTSEFKIIHKTQMPQPTLWENASLTWNPGNMTLTATKDNKKAELKLGNNKDKVPEPLRNRLFEKRRTVTANVTVEPVGNNLRIVEIQ